VRRSTDASAASVAFFTQDNTAKAIVPGSVGQYHAISNMLVFAPGQWSQEVRITNVNDLVYRGNRDYLVKLANPTEGWSLAFPSNTTVTILDDELPDSSVFPDVARPAGATGEVGALTVFIEPSQALGHWRFPWETTWRPSGSTANHLTTGDYPIEFIALDGYTLVTNASVTNLSDVIFRVQSGMNLTYTTVFTQIHTTRSGSLSIRIHPNSVATHSDESRRGQWRLQTTNTGGWHDSGAMTNLPAGLNVVEFKSIPGSEAPAPLYVQVPPEQSISYDATYWTPGLNLNVLPDYSAITNGWQSGVPYAVCGQLFTDVGYGSGFVVKPHTVLTAGHVLFDPVELSFVGVDAVSWLLQRQAGEHEPLPLTPRGWYVLEGYAAARSNDFRNGLNSNQSSDKSQQRDVAALFFTQVAGAGGYGGFLTSDTNTHVWLTDPTFKMLLGYPIEGVPPTNMGKMHRVGADTFAFDRMSVPPDGRYLSTTMSGLPGMSGGPVCVQSVTSLGTNFFIPAGVYLGGSGQSIVRVIDVDVVDLINRAENSAFTDTNHTGGGVVLVNAAYGRRAKNPGILQVRIGPPEAINRGAAWRVSPTPTTTNLGSLSAYTNYTSLDRNLTVRTPNFTIDVITNIPGFIPPPNRSITIVQNAITVLDLMYSPPPQLLFDRSNYLGIIGGVGTTYRIEVSLYPSMEGNWSLPQPITLNTGINWVPSTARDSTNKFYRAVWPP